MARNALMLGLGAVLVLWACQNEGNTPVEPDGHGLALAGGPVVQSATGSGHSWATQSGEFRNFSFTARSTIETVMGEYQQFNRYSDRIRHGNVVCLTVVGNEAWIGAHEERGDFAGLDVGFRVRDNGQGNNSNPDRISGNCPVATSAEDFCSTTPDDGCWGIEQNNSIVMAGNIQVRE